MYLLHIRFEILVLRPILLLIQITQTTIKGRYRVSQKKLLPFCFDLYSLFFGLKCLSFQGWLTRHGKLHSPRKFEFLFTKVYLTTMSIVRTQRLYVRHFNSVCRDMQKTLCTETILRQFRILSVKWPSSSRPSPKTCVIGLLNTLLLDSMPVWIEMGVTLNTSSISQIVYLKKAYKSPIFT